MSRQIFICYRRDDSSYAAGRIYDRLEQHFGSARIFMDIDKIRIGEDFVEAIGNAIGKCDVMVAIIGKGWLGASDKEGRRRLDDPSDYIRVEIASALRRDIHVVPVLIGDATVPSVDDLPQEIKPLARRHGIKIGHARFDADVDGLINGIEDVFTKLDEIAQVNSLHIDKQDSDAGTGFKPKPETKKRKSAPKIIWLFISLAVIVIVGWLLYTQYGDTKRMGALAGRWSGTIQSVQGDHFTAELFLYIEDTCEIDNTCGTYSVPSISCSGELVLKQVNSGTYVFKELNTVDNPVCDSGYYEYLRLLTNETLNWELGTSTNNIGTKGILHRNQ